MPVELIITSNFPEVGAKFEAAAAEAPAEIEAGLLEAAEQAKGVSIPILQDATPHRSGRLAASTEGDVAGGGDSATITFRQPAVSDDGVEYVDFVVHGRGDVDPVNKKALFWPGLDHPVKHAGPSKPNNYPEVARRSEQGPLEVVWEHAGRETAEKIISVLG